MKWGETQDFSVMVFQELIETKKLVWRHSSADGDWNIISNPMMPNWHRVLFTTVLFEELGATTNVRLTQVPIDATEEEIACFTEIISNMDGGCGSGYKILDGILSVL